MRFYALGPLELLAKGGGAAAGYGVKLWPALLPLKREPFCAVIPRFLSL